MEPLARHIAGATVTHSSPFADLLVPVNHEPLPANIREEWVRPLYFGLQKPQAKELVSKRLHLVSDELIAQLFASFDWRPRTAAAYLAALLGRRTYTTQIGRLLLRSDVCYAGSAYCMAFAEFNSAEAVAFLNEYLTYYLGRHDLWFDQGHAMGALSYLDRLNGTAMLSDHLAAWERFVENKSTWSLPNSATHFEDSMATLHALRHDGG